MSADPGPAAPAPNRLLGILRSWLRNWPGHARESPDDVPDDVGVPSPHCFGTVHVLVVDDNPVNLEEISALMEVRGLVPVLAADGAQAVARVHETQFDLILMDLQMPILDGLDATTAIRLFETHCSRAAAPVIAYSSRLPGAAMLATHGLNGSLGKPCDDQALEDCLVQWCPAYHPAPRAHWGGNDDGRPPG